MKAGILAVLFFLLVFPVAGFAGEHPWELKTDKDGIKVYKRSVEGSPILEFKGEVDTRVPLHKVEELYEQEKRLPEWFHSCFYSELIEQSSPDEKVIYFALAMPWPVKNRDVVYKRIRSRNAETGALEYHITAVPEKVPVHSGRVRIPFATVYWGFTPLANGGTHIVYQQHSSAGGYIPTPLVNRLTTQMPFYSLQKMRNLLEKETPILEKRS